MNILIIEDSTSLRRSLKIGLSNLGFTVDETGDGSEGLSMVLTGDYSLLILDLMLPSVDGTTILKAIRKSNKDIRVLILSARDLTEDKIEGLLNGADDYLTKPFAFSELLARVQALIRRASDTPEPTGIKIGDLSIDLLKHIVTRTENKIHLQPREFSLLEYLARNAGRVVSKTMIMENVWDYNFDPHTNIVESRISRLRDKIDKGFDTQLIHTVRGFGYVLKDNQ